MIQHNSTVMQLVRDATVTIPALVLVIDGSNALLGFPVLVWLT